MTRKIRRNDVVMETQSGGYWRPYGRVWRRIDDTHVEVIFCTKDIKILADDDLEVHNDYKGCWAAFNGVRTEFPVWHRMPTLRQLKQKASYYQEGMWRKPRPTIRAQEHKRRMAEVIKAPWSDRQVELINDFQRDGCWAPETCSKHYEDGWKGKHERYQKKHGLRVRGAMIARREGLYCPVCHDTQDWVDPYVLLGDLQRFD